jgi:hypothetical protein
MHVSLGHHVIADFIFIILQYILYLRSVFHLTKLLVPYLAKSQGCIVNVSTNVTIGPVSILTYYIQHVYCVCLCIRTLINMN